MKEITVFLVRIHKPVYLLRFINIAAMFIPLVFSDLVSSILGDIHVGIWYLGFTVLLLAQIKLVKRYRLCGKVQLNDNLLRIQPSNSAEIEFQLSMCDRILIDYTGYKGQPLSNYFLTLPIYTKEGIGFIEVSCNNQTNKYYYLAKNNYLRQLRELEESFLSRGYNITIRYS